MDSGSKIECVEAYNFFLPYYACSFYQPIKKNPYFLLLLGPLVMSLKKKKKHVALGTRMHQGRAEREAGGEAATARKTKCFF